MAARIYRTQSFARKGHQPAIRLMIVDDSIVARMVLSRMLAARPEFEIVAVATHTQEALAMLDGLRVDIILLDVEMPGTDGLTALPEILARSQGARVLIVSSVADWGAEATIKALALGAADTLPKPGAGSFGGRFADILAERLLRIGRPPPPSGAPAPDGPLRRGAVRGRSSDGRERPVRCLAIGASTGGVNALSALLPTLPASFTAPILVTQHLPAPFMPYFAVQLHEIAGRPASVAQDGAALRPGEIFVAPGDRHLCLIRTNGAVRVRLDDSPAASGCLPSVDPMLMAVAEMFGATGVGMMLSGMGRDGVLGAARLVEAGGEVLAQDAASSVVWGMPGAVVNAGLASAVLPPDLMARHIGERSDAPGWR